MAKNDKKSDLVPKSVRLTPKKTLKSEVGSQKSEVRSKNTSEKKAVVKSPKAVEKPIVKSPKVVEKPIVKATKEVRSPKSEFRSPKSEAVTKDTVEEKSVLVGITEFDGADEMKAFCMANSLNKVPGYILETKKKKADFWTWINANADKIAPAEVTFALKNSSAIEKAKKIIENQNEAAPETNSKPISMINGGEVGNKPMKDYCGSIMHYINESFSVKRHNNYQQKELDDMLANNVLKMYTYEQKHDGVGKFLMVSDGKGNSVRVPEIGYLPMY